MLIITVMQSDNIQTSLKSRSTTRKWSLKSVSNFSGTEFFNQLALLTDWMIPFSSVYSPTKDRRYRGQLIFITDWMFHSTKQRKKRKTADFSRQAKQTNTQKLFCPKGKLLSWNMWEGRVLQIFLEIIHVLVSWLR